MKSKKMTQWLLLWMALLPTIAGHAQKALESTDGTNTKVVESMAKIESSLYYYDSEEQYSLGPTYQGPITIEVISGEANQLTFKLLNVTYQNPYFTPVKRGIGNIAFENIPLDAEGNIIESDAYPTITAGNMEGYSQWDGIDYGLYPCEVEGTFKDDILNIVIRMWATHEYGGRSAEIYHCITLTESLPAYEYSRNVAEGNYGTIVLPFKPERLTGIAQLFSLVGKKMGADKKIECFVLKEETSMQAGVPYIFLSNADKITAWAPFGAEYESVPKNGHYDPKRGPVKDNNGLQGTYERKRTYDIGETYEYSDDGIEWEEYVPYKVYLLSNNQFVYAGTRSYIDAYRAYILVDYVPEFVESSDVKYYFLGADTETSIIDIRNLSKNDGGVYNLSGQRLPWLRRGVNIVNGKKVYIK